MVWRPLVTDPAARERLLAPVRAVVDAIDPPALTDVLALLDHAVLRAYLAQDDAVPDPDDECNASLARAIQLFVAHPGRLALYGGAAGVGWTVAHVADGETAETVCAAIDQALLLVLDEPWQSHYDLVEGLVGFGVYALERGDAGAALATRVLEVLEGLAEPRGPGLAWHTKVELLPEWQRAFAPEGYWNLGLAHGIPGIVALLARYVTAERESVRARSLLDATVSYLLAAEPMSNGGRFPTWHASRPSGAETTARLAWCYGDLGVSVALLAAANATDHETWRAEAVALARDCATRALGSVRDTGICHGAAGAAHLFNRLYQATGDAACEAAARRWIDRVLAMRTDRPIAGFPSAFQQPGHEVEWRADSSVLTGAAGVALTLHAAVSAVEPNWDRLLLADLTPV